MNWSIFALLNLIFSVTGVRMSLLVSCTGNPPKDQILAAFPRSLQSGRTLVIGVPDAHGTPFPEDPHRKSRRDCGAGDSRLPRARHSLGRRVLGSRPHGT